MKKKGKIKNHKIIKYKKSYNLKLTLSKFLLPKNRLLYACFYFF